MLIIIIIIIIIIYRKSLLTASKIWNFSKKSKNFKWGINQEGYKSSEVMWSIIFDQRLMFKVNKSGPLR